MLCAMSARANAAAELTKRQREVLRLIARGKTNFEIANELGISLDGAKWHIREIMARLGCDSREEAVAIWRAQRSVPERARRAIAIAANAMTSQLWRAAAAGGIVAVVVVAVLATVLTNRGDEDTQAASPTADAQSPTALAVAPTEAVEPFPDGPIAFRSCGTSSFQRPDFAEMADVFTNPRFGGQTGNTSLRPAPVYFSYYLRNVYRIVPRAVSGNIEPVALSGSTQPLQGIPTVLIPAANPCDEAMLLDRTLDYHMFWFIDMVPLAVRLNGGTLAVEAERLAGSKTTFIFPDPPVPLPAAPTKDQNPNLPAFREVRVIDTAGRLIYSHGLSGQAQYAEDGSLVSATNAFGTGEIEFEIRGHAQAIVIYTSASSGPTNVVVRDQTVRVWTSDPVSEAPETWQEVFRRELPTGTYRVTGGSLLVVPVGTPLP
jgi:DNA-binding CsgD family transcriptional regulator